MSLRLEAELTHQNAAQILRSGLAFLQRASHPSDFVVDGSALQQFDSSALAILLAWQRAAAERQQVLRVYALPTKLLSLAHVYGMETLLPETTTA